MQVTSKPGSGTAFEIFFPSLNGEAPQHTPLIGESVDFIPASILFVDDEYSVRRLAKTILETAGHRVAVMADGQEAVDHFRQHSATTDLIILDITMPVMNGEEALHRIRDVRPEVPVLMSSGYDQVEFHNKFRGSKSVSFLQKPYTANLLLDQVQTILAKRQNNLPAQKG